MLEILFVILYIGLLSSILIYCLVELGLAINYMKLRKKMMEKNTLLANSIVLNDHPFVTIQLPVFNEMYVVERLIDHSIKMDYPKERFEIQVLDDSTDETVEIS